jgi:hypothetical protein
VLSSAGSLQTLHLEADLVAHFGILDGNADVDALHLDAGGRLWLSFAETEDSSVLSTDSPSLITDGSILFFDPATQSVGVAYTEAEVDQMVSTALGSSSTILDVFGLSQNAQGELYFCVQSPSAHDASIFSEVGGGTLVMAESGFGFSNAIELNAVDVRQTTPSHLVASVSPYQIPAGTVAQIDLYGGAVLQDFVLLLSWSKGDRDLFPGPGFGGLALSVSDPLLLISLSVSWLRGTTDAGGQASISLPPAPLGVATLLYGQPYDLTGRTFGTPFAIELQG